MYYANKPSPFAAHVILIEPSLNCRSWTQTLDARGGGWIHSWAVNHRVRRNNPSFHVLDIAFHMMQILSGEDIYVAQVTSFGRFNIFS
jgi:hypothetical protein